MSIFNENNQQTNDNNSQAQFNQTVENKGFFALPPALLQIIPWIPLAVESMTGQKIPQMTGTIADIQMAINQISNSQQAIINNQKELAQRIVNLESNAVNQLNNLLQQFQSLRINPERNRKQLEYNENYD